MGDVTVRLKEVKIKKFGTWEARNEVFIVSLALDLNKQAQHIEPADELGKLIPQSFLAFNKYAIVSVSPLFHKVRRGDKLPLLGDGLILYGPRDPMGKISLHAAIMESDTDNRDIAKKMKKALVKAKVFETVEAAGTIASIAQPKIAVVARPLSIAIRYAFETFLYFMKLDGNDVIADLHYSSWNKPNRGYVVSSDNKPFEYSNRYIDAKIAVSHDE